MANLELTEKIRWTSADLELLPQDEWKRYEIIDGELFVTRAPDWNHQRTCCNIWQQLEFWSREIGLGKANLTPGVIFTDADNVIPDVVWVSNDNLANLIDEDGHLTGAPDLVVEVLSPGKINERRDKEAKLKLYSLQGVKEYWIVDWRQQKVEIYRREQVKLNLVASLFAEDELISPLLPNFRCQIKHFFR